MALTRIPIRARALALVPLGALAVHELRYLVAFGSHADRALAQQGHVYLAWVGLAVALLAGAMLGSFVARLTRARRGAGPSPASSWLATWAALTAGLLVTYVVQELAEGLVAAGHPAGLAGVLAAGGWVAAPASLAVGGALALLLRGARAAIALVAERARRARRPRPAPAAPLRPRPVVQRPLAPLASAAAGRAPPLAILTLG
jgi:hypothetical protein